jgi:Papain family cysteine protease
MVELHGKGRPVRKPHRLRRIDGPLHALPDKEDEEDQAFKPSLATVPDEVPLAPYTALALPIMDQRDEHACTGFGLAAVAHYLIRRHAPQSAHVPVSPRMMYEMAKRYDEWTGVNYQGSSARGAVKGWHKHGVCALSLWPYVSGQIDRELSPPRRKDAAKRPLLRYERVEETNLAAIRAAIAEIGIVFATVQVHQGWRNVGSDGHIPLSEDQLGTHAFAFVGYGDEGFWLQNSKGPDWGRGGFGYLSNTDWARNGLDAWVAHLGPVAAEV